jgi:uncharacterized repeat protein (TIGR03943 family)
MGPWLLVAGALLAVLGAGAVVAALRGSQSRQTAPDSCHHEHDQPEHERHEDSNHDQAWREHPEHEHGEHEDGEPERGGHEHAEDEHSDHEHGDRIGWLLLVPVLALLLVVPPALGSFGVDRSRISASSAGEFQPLPAGPQPHQLTMLEFSQRAFDHGGNTLRGVQLRITGFVAKPSDGDAFELARYQIACCAADAVAAVARVSGAPGAAPTRDSWFTVTGTFGGMGKDGIPEFLATSLQQIAAPVDPYE